MSCAGTIASTAPVAIALSGMPLCCGAVAVRALGQGEAAACLDCLQAQCPIMAGPRQHDADGILTLVRSKAVEKLVDGSRLTWDVRRQRPQMQPTLLDGCDKARRYDMDLIWTDDGMIGCFSHGHVGPARNDLGEQALAVGR